MKDGCVEEGVVGVGVDVMDCGGRDVGEDWCEGCVAEGCEGVG